MQPLCIEYVHHGNTQFLRPSRLDTNLWFVHHEDTNYGKVMATCRERIAGAYYI